MAGMRQRRYTTFNWRDYLNPRIPQGRFALFVVVLIVLYVITSTRITTAVIVSFIALMLGRILGLLLGFTIHEWAHAASAFRLGGWSALPDQSRLTLDPRSHIDPFGFLMALVVGLGWARPVPVRPGAFRPNEKQSMVIVAFAGPLTNLIIGLVFALLLRLLHLGGVLEELGRTFDGTLVVAGGNGVYDFIFEVLAVITYFNLALFLFNLIPLSPLDGWKVLIGLLPDEYAYQVAQYERQSNFLLIGLLFIGFLSPRFNIIWGIIGPPLNALFELFTGFGFYL